MTDKQLTPLQQQTLDAAEAKELGKDIQHYSTARKKWEDSHPAEPMYLGSGSLYRPKPKPRVAWFCYRTGEVNPFDYYVGENHPEIRDSRRWVRFEEKPKEGQEC